MTPTRSLFLVLLSVFLTTRAAHGDDSSEISLHNDDALGELIVVRNWTLICEQLCSLNLSGPSCGLDCSSAAASVGDPHSSSEEQQEVYDFPPEYRSELCETLCDSGLGGNRCLCPVKIQPAAFDPRSDRSKICLDFCRFHRVTLNGCSRCPFEKKFEKKKKKPSKTSAEDLSPPPTPQPQSAVPNLFENALAQPNIRIIAYDNPADTIQAPPTGTTPDWSRLCAMLCRQGTGGILCNCDLAPF